MRPYLTSTILLLLLFFNLNASAQKKNYKTINVPEKGSDITILDSAINLYHAGDFYISGQPDREIFKGLKEKGLDLVINIRTPEEMKALEKEGFDQASFLDSLEVPYVLAPIGGNAGYTVESIEKINEAILGHKGNIMIHCRSAGRATNAWVAWLINYYKMPVNDAITLGKQMQLRFYIEDLLGYELSFGKK
jgi:protein tyrosine phosphatase (PTP) superfamily phosphohydrolase (DUF442 family)